jgi:SAM-dependent methyltransferase
MLRPVLKRLLNPAHLWRVIHLQRGRRKGRVYDDPELELYHKILPGDYLHWGYFDDPSVDPRDVTLNMLARAQQRYAEGLLDLIEDGSRPVLDVGCGMGGMLGLMGRRGLAAVGLTPDVNQIRWLRAHYPNEIIEGRFEDLAAEKHAARFGTVLNSESLQYLDLEASLPVVEKILARGGRWVVCDYFRTGASGERSGHEWPRFESLLAGHGFTVTRNQDVTANLLPTVAFAHHLATQVGVPLKDFALAKMEAKAPGLHYAIQDALPGVEAKIARNLEAVDPVSFAANKRYLRLVIERSS